MAKKKTETAGEYYDRLDRAHARWLTTRGTNRSHGAASATPAAQAKRLGKIETSKPWKGSTVTIEAGAGGAAWRVVTHPGGAVARVRCSALIKHGRGS